MTEKKEVHPIEEHAVNTATVLSEIKTREKLQHELVSESEFIKCIDNDSFIKAKAVRTSLVSARTSLDKEKKIAVGKINSFKSAVSSEYDKLIAITRPIEEKQQEEVKAYQAKKDAEKAEKERIKREKMEAIKKDIDTFIEGLESDLEKATFSTVDMVIMSINSSLEEYDKKSTEDHLAYYLEREAKLKASFDVVKFKLDQKEEERKERELLRQKAAEEEKRRKEAEAIAERLRKEQEAELAKQQEEIKKQREEARILREKLEEEKAKAEAAKSKEEERIAKIEKEKQAKLEAEREAKEKAEAEKKRKQREEALKPDLEKAISFIESIGIPEVPQVKDTNIYMIVNTVGSELEKFKEKIIQDLKSVK